MLNYVNKNIFYSSVLDAVSWVLLRVFSFSRDTTITTKKIIYKGK